MGVCNLDVKERTFNETSERMRGANQAWNSLPASNEIYLADILFDTQALMKTEMKTIVTNWLTNNPTNSIEKTHFEITIFSNI